MQSKSESIALKTKARPMEKYLLKVIKITLELQDTDWIWLVLGVKRLNLPLPQQPTVMTCTLNNGIHFVTTPEGQLANDCRIDQEFEL